MPIFLTTLIKQSRSWTKIGLLCLILGGGLWVTATKAQNSPPPEQQQQDSTPRVSPEAIARAVKQDAFQMWGFPADGSVAKIERKQCSSTLNFSCSSPDELVWEVTLESENQRWIYVSDIYASNKMMVARENLSPELKNVPQTVLEAVRQLAGQHGSMTMGRTISLRPEQVLVVRAEPATWNNSCLELVHSGERCLPDPVEGWRVTVAIHARYPLVYRTDSLGTQVKAEIPDAIAQQIFEKATREWGLPPGQGRILGAERAEFAYGCDPPPLIPIGCDPAIMKGWRVSLEQDSMRWDFRAMEGFPGIELLSRDKPFFFANASNILPETLRDAARTLAAAHFEVKPSQVLLAQFEPQTWSDSCLGLASPVEDCARETIEGFRLTVAGKTGQVQVYRTDRSGQIIRTEAGDGLPPRTDVLPTRLAKTVLQDASSRLRVPLEELRILNAEQVYRQECLRMPGEPPQCHCVTLRSVADGWQVTVTNFQQELNYRIDAADAIAKL
jgi:hypothetical protein